MLYRLLIKFKENLRLQKICAIVPLIVLSIYCLAYSYQTATVLRTLVVNNTLVEKNYNSGYFRKVLATTEDSEYMVLESLCNTEVFDIQNEGYVTSATIQGDRIEIGDIYIRSSDYFNLDAGVLYLGDRTYNVSSGDLAFYIVVNEGVVHLVKDDYDIELENSINFSLNSDGDKVIVVGNELESYTNLPHVYTTYSMLEAMVVYYDYNSKSLVTLLDSSFIKNYIFDSNLPIGIVSLFSWFIVHIILSKKDMLVYKNKFYYMWYFMLILLQVITNFSIYLLLYL